MEGMTDWRGGSASGSLRIPFWSEDPRLRNIAVEANDIGKTSDIRFKGARSW